MAKGDDMERETELIRKLYRALNRMMCEAKVARSYGTGHNLTYSDIGLLKSVRRYESAKAGDLSQYLGITNGAVTQLARKLMDKGYLAPYRQEGNRKEVYYRLTDAGEQACRGYDAYSDRMKGRLVDYLAPLDDGTVAAIDGMLDLVLATSGGCGRCDGSDAAEETSEKKTRCAKCQTIF